MKAYYEMNESELREQLIGGQGNLSETQVSEHQKRFGWNELAEGHQKHPIQIFFEQFKDFLVMILLAAAIVSLFLGETESAVVILVVINMNALLGTIQTIKAEHSLSSLKQLSAPNAKVLRNGMITQIPAREVTVGDQVFLEAGDYVPADGRLIENASLKVDESALTGESLGVEKQVEVIEGECVLADRKNMVYSGSFVTYGRGSYLVTDIGMQTEVGKIAELLKNTSEKKTPLQVNLDQFGRKLSIMILILCAALFGLQVLKGGQIADAFLFAVALAVAAIPEALSSIVTIVLSFGTQKMAKEGAIIRKLQAVEGLGSVSIICSDKTGTLTQNKMTVEHYYVDGKDVPVDQICVENPSHRQLMEFSVLCNDSTNRDGKEIGDPTETAMINLSDNLGVSSENIRNDHVRFSEIPFDSDRKMMSTFNRFQDGYFMITKGAVDVMIHRITHIQKNGTVVPITEKDMEQIKEANADYSSQGLRVLGLGYRRFHEEKTLTLDDENDLIFLGLIAMMDPPRPESMQAVRDCKRAGIRPIMITGDHKVTASAIARRIGILTDDTQACEGVEIDGMSDEALQDFVEKINVYARVTPEHKIRIVRAWQNKGHSVSMTGDGVNDAPALKQADIGVAMGITGTEVSKDAASMVLTDDNFSTIIKAVENGRNVYENIKHAIQFLLSGNFAGILVVLFASLFGLPVPFAAVHLLFINLVTDSLPAIALGLEPYRAGVMDQKPRPLNESILTKDFLQRIGIEGAVLGMVTFGGFLYGLQQGNVRLASTMAFSILCLSRLVHGYNCKSNDPVLFKKECFNNKYMQGAFALGVLLVTLVLTIPVFSGPFAVETLNMKQLAMVYGCALLNLPIIQGIKFIRNRWREKNERS